jgi:hypothetical protein
MTFYHGFPWRREEFVVTKELGVWLRQEREARSWTRAELARRPYKFGAPRKVLTGSLAAQASRCVRRRPALQPAACSAGRRRGR